LWRLLNEIEVALEKGLKGKTLTGREKTVTSLSFDTSCPTAWPSLSEVRPRSKRLQIAL